MPGDNSYNRLRRVVERTRLVVGERLEEEGTGFVGVVLGSYEGKRKELLVALESSLGLMPFDGGNRYVVKRRDLSTRFFSEGDLEWCRSYRVGYPVSLFLFDDPRGVMEDDKGIYRVEGGGIERLTFEDEEGGIFLGARIENPDMPDYVTFCRGLRDYLGKKAPLDIYRIMGGLIQLPCDKHATSVCYVFDPGEELILKLGGLRVKKHFW